jgi:hypothetical protein
MQVMIEKENNFKQPGERYRSWDTARFCLIFETLTLKFIGKFNNVVSFWRKVAKATGFIETIAK